LQTVKEIDSACWKPEGRNGDAFELLLKHKDPRAIFVILEWFLQPRLASIWLRDINEPVETSSQAAQENQESISAVLESHIDSHRNERNFDKYFEFANTDAAPLDFLNCFKGFGSAGMTSLLYVEPSTSPKYRWLRSELVFPVQWKLGVNSHHDPMLPTSLRTVADEVKSILENDFTLEGQHDSASPQYEHFYLKFSTPFSPINYLDTANDSPSFLDSLFPTGASDSAFASLLVSLYVAAHQGRPSVKCMATGCLNRVTGGIANVGNETLEKKLKLVAWFSNFIGASQEDPVCFFVPASQRETAMGIVKKDSDWNDGTCLLDQFGLLQQAGASLYESVSGLRRTNQVKPDIGDPLESMQLWYSSREGQHQRSMFHASVINKSGHVIPKLRKAWGKIREDENIDGSIVCVSVLSRSWEWPLIDAEVFGSSAKDFRCRVVYPNDLFLKNEIKMIGSGESLHARLGSVLGGNVEESFEEVLLDLLNWRDLDSAKRQQKVIEFMKTIFNDADNPTYIINRSSGSQFLSDCLVAAAPKGAFVVSYWGRTDPLSNLPIPGELDLVVYRKDNDDGLQLLTASDFAGEQQEGAAATNHETNTDGT